MPAGRRTLLGIVSLALHAGALAAVTLLPEPVRVETIEIGDPIVVVQWSGDGETTTAEPTARGEPDAQRERVASAPTGAADVEARAPARPQDPPSARRRAAPRVRTPSPATTPPVAEIDAPAEPPSADDAGTDAGDRPSPHALALQGLREHSTARAQLPSPRASPGIAPARAGEHTVPLPDGSPDGPPNDDALPRSLADAGFHRNKRGDYVYRAPGGQFTAKLLRDGRISFKDHLVTVSAKDGYAPRLPGIPELVRKAQKRELWSHDKAKLARATFELRLGIAVAFAERQIDSRLKTLYVDLLQIWGATATPAPTRRATLFERWDECDETMKVDLPGFEDARDTRIDALRKSAGEQARDKITAFVRRQLPKGSEHAYPDDELERLNRHRHSKTRFAPYDVPAAE